MFDEKQVRAGAGMLVGGCMVAIVAFALYNQTYALLKLPEHEMSFLMLQLLMAGAIYGVVFGMGLALLAHPVGPIVGSAVFSVIAVLMARRMGVMFTGGWGPDAIHAANAFVAVMLPFGAAVGSIVHRVMIKSYASSSVTSPKKT